jgi:hypothetical protein
MSRFIEKNLEKDGIDWRGFLKSMARAGTGALCAIQGGVLKSYALSDVMQHKVGDFKGDLNFLQISDSHIGQQQRRPPYRRQRRQSIQIESAGYRRRVPPTPSPNPERTTIFVPSTRR